MLDADIDVVFLSQILMNMPVHVHAVRWNRVERVVRKQQLELGIRDVMNHAQVALVHDKLRQFSAAIHVVIADDLDLIPGKPQQDIVDVMDIHECNVTPEDQRVAWLDHLQAVIDHGLVHLFG